MKYAIITSFVLALATVPTEAANAVVYVNMCRVSTPNVIPSGMAIQYLMADNPGMEPTCKQTKFKNPRTYEYRCNPPQLGVSMDYSITYASDPNDTSPSAKQDIYLEYNWVAGYHDVTRLTCQCGGGELRGGCWYTFHVGSYNIGLEKP